MKKNIFTLLFALVASVGMVSAEITVRLDAESCKEWDQVYLWAWNANGNVFETWPGKAITKDDRGYYSYTFLSDEIVNIIWSDGTNQTIDITNVYTSTCYALNSTTGKEITVSVLEYYSHIGIGGKFYNLYAKDHTAELTYFSHSNINGTFEYNKDYDWIQGSTIIPEQVTYKNVTYKVTTISDYAFYNCSNLTSVIIPNSVTSIGNMAFSNCTSLTSVTMGNGVTSIGNMAFSNCTSLTSVTMGNGVENIGAQAFSGCTKLASIEIPNSVTSIKGLAFRDCKSLLSIEIPNSVTSIGYGVFYNSGIKIPVYNEHIYAYFPHYSGAYTIPDGIESIAGGAFEDCSRLTSVTIPNSVTSIGEQAFYYCKSLTSVTMGNGVTSIGVAAFLGCSSLTSITIPANVTYIGRDAFSYSALKSVIWNAKNCSRYPFSKSIITLRFGPDVEVIPDSLCYDMWITSIIIPNSVKSIGNYAFSGCYALTSIEIPNSVTSIGNAAFRNCSGLTSVTIGNGVTSIGNSAFSGCKSLPVENNLRYADSYLVGVDDNSLPTYHIKDGTKWIGTDAFSNCQRMTDIEIPNSVMNIGGSAFSNCIGLTSMTIPNSVTSIGDYAFYGCSILNSIEIPNSVTSIGDNAFYNCKKLTSVEIPNSVTSIGEQAFSLCAVLTSIDVVTDNPNYCSIDGVLFNKDNTTLIQYPEGKQGTYTIPSSVTNIGNYAFYECTGLTSVTIPNSVTSIGIYAFRDCRSLTSVEIPNSVTSIGGYAFYECSGLTSVTIPNSVTSIGVGVFYQSNIRIVVWDAKNIPDFTYSNTPFPSSITAITFGENVEYIPAYLCYDYYQQPVVTIKAVTPPTLGKMVFNGSPAHIYVPCGSIYAYKAATNWSTYASVIEYELLPFTITITPSNEGQVIKPTVVCDEMILTVNPNNGYIFTQWSDGNTDNPRAIELTQDTSFTALYAVSKKGTCGDDLALTWEYDDENKTLSISGNGALNSNYTYGLEAPQNMTKLVLGEEITSIGQEAFKNCSNLQSVEWNIKNCVNYQRPAFPTSITSFTFGQNVEHIPAHLCRDMKHLESITIPNSVVDIGEGAFRYCSSLTTIEISSGVTSIGEYAFSGCNSLTSITLPKSITSIGDYAFGYCSSLFSIEISNGATNIGENAFSDCSIKEIHFMGTIEEWLNKTWYSTSITSSYDLYIQNDKITNISIPNSITSIGEGAFRGCCSLTSVTIGNSVTSIGNFAFDLCEKIESVALGENVTHYGGYAFSGCKALTSIYNYREKPAKLGTNAFRDVDYFDCTLYVLASSVDMYKSSGSSWKDFFFNIKPIGAASVTTTDIAVTSTTNTANISWPAVSGAETYELEIKDKSGNEICTLIFNAQGQLTQIAFHAPSSDGAPQRTQTAGFSFTVTGLDSGTSYDLTMTSKDAIGQIIEEQTLSFTTGANIPTGFENVQSDKVQSTKVLHDGQIYILRGEKVYDAQGKRVK